jgi:hypothetical protein
VSKACSSGLLESCWCGNSRKQGETRSAWEWGACPDNLQYGRAFTRRFLVLNRRPEDLNSILFHQNSLLGLNV